MGIQSKDVVSTLERERRCIEVATTIIVQRLPQESLSRQILRALLGDLGLWNILWLPIIIVVAPFQIRQSYGEHKKRETERKTLEDGAANHLHPIRNAGVLWENYGPRVDGGFSDEDILRCLSEWMRLLFDGEYYYSPEQIRVLFDEASRRQGQAYNSAAKRGIKLNMRNWRFGVVARLWEEAPDY